MVKSGVYVLTSGNLIEVDIFIGKCICDVYFFSNYIQIYSEEFNYLFSDAEYLGEL